MVGDNRAERTGRDPDRHGHSHGNSDANADPHTEAEADSEAQAVPETEPHPGRDADRRHPLGSLSSPYRAKFWQRAD
jgi:hypothetical protein